MNRLQFLKRLLATLFGAAMVKHGRSMPEALEGGENGHPDPSALRQAQCETSGSARQSVPPPPKYLLSTTVAGQWYYEFPTVGADLLGEDEDLYTAIDREFTEHPAQLILEPDNPYDHRAIAVHWNGYKMGYVPRKDNKVLYNLLKDGHTLQTKLRLQLNFEPEPDHLYTYDFENVYEMRIRVYLLESSVSKNA